MKKLIIVFSLVLSLCVTPLCYGETLQDGTDKGQKVVKNQVVEENIKLLEQVEEVFTKQKFIQSERKFDTKMVQEEGAFVKEIFSTKVIDYDQRKKVVHLLEENKYNKNKSRFFDSYKEEIYYKDQLWDRYNLKDSYVFSGEIEEETYKDQGIFFEEIEALSYWKEDIANCMLVERKEDKKELIIKINDAYKAGSIGEKITGYFPLGINSETGSLEIILDEKTLLPKNIKGVAILKKDKQFTKYGEIAQVTYEVNYDFKGRMSVPNEIARMYPTVVKYNKIFEKNGGLNYYFKGVDDLILKNKFNQGYLTEYIILNEVAQYEDALEALNQYITYYPYRLEGYLRKIELLDKMELWEDVTKTVEVAEKTLGWDSQLAEYRVKYYGFDQVEKSLEAWKKVEPYSGSRVVTDMSYYDYVGNYDRVLSEAEYAQLWDEFRNEIVFHQIDILAKRNIFDAYDMCQRYKHTMIDDADFCRTYLGILRQFNLKGEIAEALQTMKPYFAQDEEMINYYTNYLKTSEADELKNLVEGYLYLKNDSLSKITDILEADDAISCEEVHEITREIVDENDKHTYVLEFEEQVNEEVKEETEEVKIKEPSVEYKVEGQDRYIKIKSFDYDTAELFEDAIGSLGGLVQTDTSRENLIIDLRGNGGGSVASAEYIINMLLPECTIGTMITKDGHTMSLESKGYQVPFNKIFVLVDKNTASSSELLTLSLKEFLNNVTVIGEQTYGKGVAQSVYYDREKEYILFLVDCWWNVKEKNINGVGITPDIQVKSENLDDYLQHIK